MNPGPTLPKKLENSPQNIRGYTDISYSAVIRHHFTTSFARRHRYEIRCSVFVHDAYDRLGVVRDCRAVSPWNLGLEGGERGELGNLADVDAVFYYDHARLL